jgi:hypothetical protein
MQMLPDGKGSIGTGSTSAPRPIRWSRRGRARGSEFLKSLPGVRIGRGDVVEVDNQMGIGHPGIFAGGDMIGGARTMTAAVGHGKKAARNIDAWLRGEVFDKPPKHAVVEFETLNLPMFLDAERRRQSELPVEQRRGFGSGCRPLNRRRAMKPAVFFAAATLRMRQSLRVPSEQAIICSAKGRFYRYDYDLCTVCASATSSALQCDQINLGPAGTMAGAPCPGCR